MSSDDSLFDKAKARQALGFNQQQQLVPITDSPALTGDDSNRDKQVHDLTNSHLKNFDEKIYLFPEEYNQLRKELFENFPRLWQAVGWYMAYDALEFTTMMNAALDMNVVLDSEKVGWTCEQYLKELRKRRGAA